MKLLLYDISLDGHHGSYLSSISAEAVARGWQVAVVVPKRDEQHVQVKLLRDIVGHDNVCLSRHWAEIPPRFTRLALLRYHVAQRKAAFESLKPFRGQYDFAYTSNLDYMDKAMQIFGSPSFPMPFGGMSMRSRFHMASVGVPGRHPKAAAWIQKLAFRRLACMRGMACITTADPSLAEFCKIQTAGHFGKVKYVPEIGMDPPSITRVEAREKLGFRVEDRVILVYGAISKRKAIEALLDSVEAQGLPSPLKVLVVGQAGDEMTRILADRLRDGAEGRGRAVLGFADRRTEEIVFAAADAVWVAYKEHALMSGVFCQALCCGIPVITADYGLLAWLARKYNVGIVINALDTAETGRALTRLFSDTDRYFEYCKNTQPHAAAHAPVRFGRAVCDAIWESLN